VEGEEEEVDGDSGDLTIGHSRAPPPHRLIPSPLAKTEKRK
jgi:hypothetical protein